MKLTKHAEVLTKLHEIVSKNAEAQHVTGVPGKDTSITSVHGKDTANKEQVGSPEKHTQGYEQKKSKDASKPMEGSKTAEELAVEVLALIKSKQAEEAAVEAAPAAVEAPAAVAEVAAPAAVEAAPAAEAVKEANVQKSVSGTPGKDTHIVSVKAHDTVNKEEAGSPEKHTQGYKQDVSSAAGKPMAHAKTSEEADAELAAKVASFELGRQLAIDLIKSATAAAPKETEIMKEAGRRDFDLMIAEAAEQLKGEQEKHAEASGAAAFDELVKQATLETLAEENKELKDKLASFEKIANEAKLAADAKKNEDDKQKFAQEIVSQVITALKSEVVANPAK